MAETKHQNKAKEAVGFLTFARMKYLLFTLIVFALSSCGNSKTPIQCDEVTIDSEISQDPIYREMDKEKEIFSMFEEEDSLIKRTSNVSYFSDEEIDLQDTLYSKFNNCRAYYFKQDTLSINIGFGTGFGGRGFIIFYKDKKYYTKAYWSTDVIIEGMIEPTHKIIYQKLTLDKPEYQTGDSLYGKIDFKSIETDSEGETTQHFGKGHFRTKVGRF